MVAARLNTEPDLTPLFKVVLCRPNWCVCVCGQRDAETRRRMFGERTDGRTVRTERADARTDDVVMKNTECVSNVFSCRTTTRVLHLDDGQVPTRCGGGGGARGAARRSRMRAHGMRRSDRVTANSTHLTWCVCCVGYATTLSATHSIRLLIILQVYGVLFSAPTRERVRASGSVNIRRDTNASCSVRISEIGLSDCWNTFVWARLISPQEIRINS